MWMEVHSIGLRQEGVAWGEDAWNTLRGGGTEKSEWKTKSFERAARLVKRQEVGALKRGTGTFLETMIPKRLSHPTLDYHLFGGTLNVHKGSARIKSQPDSQSAYSENI